MVIRSRFADDADETDEDEFNLFIRSNPSDQRYPRTPFLRIILMPNNK